MQYGIGCNIVDVVNQLSFAYKGLAPEFQVFVTLRTKSTKTSDFIRVLEKKQNVWPKMMTAPTAPHKYYNPAQRLSLFPYRTSLPSQSKAFLYYQSQQCLPQALLPWQSPKCSSGWTPPTPLARPQRQYIPQPFHLSFVPQRQQYPANNQRYHRPLSPTGANCDSVLRIGQNNPSPLVTSYAPNNLSNKSAPCHLGPSYQPTLHQPY